MRSLMVASVVALACVSSAAEARPNEATFYKQVTEYKKIKKVRARHSARARKQMRVLRHLSRKPITDMTADFGGGSIVARARRYIGTNPTGWASVWCARFLRMVVPRDPGPNFNLARNWARLGRRLSSPQINAIAVMSRRGGGHVGVVSGFDRKGNPIIISGNSRRVGRGRVVSERVYPRTRKIIYVALNS